MYSNDLLESSGRRLKNALPEEFFIGRVLDPRRGFLFLPKFKEGGILGRMQPSPLTRNVGTS